MKKKYKVVLLTTALISAIDSASCIQEYSIAITPETIQCLAPKLPEKELFSLNDFMQTHDHLLQRLASIPHPLKTYRSKIAEDKTALELVNLKSHYGTNYVFKIPNQPLYVQISGFSNRIPGLKNAAGLAPHYVENEDYTIVFNEKEQKNEAFLLPALFEQLTKHLGNNLTPTYQTISRLANYLSLQATIETKKLTFIKTMPTYLVHIPHRPELVCDENYIVLQAQIPEKIYQLDKHPERLELLAEAALEELFVAVTQSGALWDLGGANLYVTEKNEFLVTDLEQPNYSNPKLFYYKEGRDEKEFRHNVCLGIMSINNQLKKIYHNENNSEKLRTKAADLMRLLKKLVIENKELNNAKNAKYPEYKKEIIDSEI